jgi:hypothetical protein
LLLRRLERWLHQHIFKVGWLLTKNFHTTTIVYYAFFLPGVFLHELSYWLVAGILDVRAERIIRMPEKQEIAELRLNFIRLPRNTPPFKLAIITMTPLIVGVFFVWFIADNVLDVTGFANLLFDGNRANLNQAIATLTSAPDFWLWIYLLFAVSNTMVPNLQDLRGARVLLTVIGAATLIFIILGLGNEVVVAALVGPVTDALYVLAGIFLIIIAIDLFMTGVLGTIEAIVERITGDSATFEKGKLVAMTRKEILELKKRQATRALQSTRRAQKTAPYHSIYELPLPIPSGPEREAVTQIDTQIITPEDKPAVAASFGNRPAPAVIPGVVARKAIEEDEDELADDMIVFEDDESEPADLDEAEEDDGADQSQRQTKVILNLQPDEHSALDSEIDNEAQNDNERTEKQSEDPEDEKENAEAVHYEDVDEESV